VLGENRDNYSRVASELQGEYNKISKLRRDLKRDYPNASAGFVNAIFNREAEAIQNRIDELTEEGALYKTNYDLRL
jgi:hypothetical protein